MPSSSACTWSADACEADGALTLPCAGGATTSAGFCSMLEEDAANKGSGGLCVGCATASAGCCPALVEDAANKEDNGGPAEKPMENGEGAMGGENSSALATALSLAASAANDADSEWAWALASVVLAAD